MSKISDMLAATRKWQPIETHEGRYEVSICGEVRKVSGKLLKQWLSDQGYSLVRLSSPRLVARVHHRNAHYGQSSNSPFIQGG